MLRALSIAICVLIFAPQFAGAQEPPPTPAPAPRLGEGETLRPLVPPAPGLPPLPAESAPVVPVLIDPLPPPMTAEPEPLYRPRWIEGGKGWYFGTEARIYATSIDAEDGAHRVKGNTILSPRVYLGYGFDSGWAVEGDYSNLSVSRIAQDGVQRTFNVDAFHIDLLPHEWGYERLRFRTNVGLQIASLGFSRYGADGLTTSGASGDAPIGSGVVNGPDGPIAVDIYGPPDSSGQSLNFRGSFTGVGPRVGLSGRLILFDPSLSVVAGGNLGTTFGDRLDAVNADYRLGLEWRRKSLSISAGYQGEFWSVADDRGYYWHGPQTISSLFADGLFINVRVRF